ncbi:MAG TPA: beta-N-acetylhexosaminidase [Gemmatimonadales bacterium]|nr:beta-N-acetylhexosaminidase [Gemmatimonadales bacterium]
MTPTLGLLALVLALDTTAAPPVIPRPAHLTSRAGTFTLTSATVIATDRATRSLGQVLADYLFPATGFRLVVGPAGSAPAGASAISIGLDSTLSALGAEGYRLDVRPTRVTIRAFKPAGAFYAIETVRELFPPAILRSAEMRGVAWTLPALTIEDYPRFEWRGMHLDVARHFMPKEFVKKLIDLLALHKFNRLHLHLTDDQGWRIQIRRYPRLTEVGAWRRETLVGRSDRDSTTWRFDGVRHGGFYAQDDIAELVAYARARFVTIVPEIEMPGHSQAAIASYPELGNTGATLPVWTAWGVDENILNPSDSTIAFEQNVLTEVMALFPGTWIHIGGDEAPKTQWKASAVAQARMRALGLKDEDELQSWFTRRMDEFLTAHGRTLVGWDEILQGGLSPHALVMSWRGVDGGIVAAKAGHDVVMAPGSHTYFDHYQSADTANEPLAIGGYLPLDTVYAFEPVPAALTPAEARHVLGAQGQVWTEYIPDPKRVEYMAFPRACALAEVLWTPREGRDYQDFRRRLTGHLSRLAALDVNARPPRDSVDTRFSDTRR